MGSDLYLSAKEAYVLRWASLIWGTLQFWDFFHRRVVRRIQERNAAAAAAAAAAAQDQGNTGGEQAR